MKDKIVLVTGASSGIGLETARGLARMGATVLMVARDTGRGAWARDEVKRSTGNENVHLLLCNLESQAQVRRLATAVKEDFEQLHVLVNNAGIILGRRELTEDGVEKQLAVNHLAPFLLTSQLLDVLEASAPARIVNVASEAHRRARLDLDDLNSEHGYRSVIVYSNTKLMNILSTYELARRLDGTGVTANCLHPGVVRTQWGDTGTRPFSVLVKVARPFMLSRERGARTSIYVASSPEVAKANGLYFVKRRPRKSNKESLDPAVQERLWQRSEELTGMATPRVSVKR